MLFRSFGGMLIKIIDKVSKENDRMLMTVFEVRLHEHFKKLLQKAEERKKDTSSILEKYDSILIMIEAAEPLNVGELVSGIEKIFERDPVDSVILATVHRSKGLEADTVYFLGRELNEFFMSKADGWKFEQEVNNIYVGITRAKRRLVYLPLGKRKKKLS